MRYPEEPGDHDGPGGELALIEQIRRASAARPAARVRLGIGDDCAVLRPPPGQEILVTTDLCLEGRHFRRDWHTPESAGHRCLARGLSDLAAMGATPLAAFLSLAVPSGLKKKWLDRFFLGLRALADQAKVPLAGGDTAQSPSQHLLADIVLIGSAPIGRALRRSTARPGDLLFVTGSLGGAAAELLSLRSLKTKFNNLGVPHLDFEMWDISGAASDSRTKLRPGPNRPNPQLFPLPRLAVGQALLRRRLATACIDISDGLSTDLQHLCDASHLSANLDLGSLPIHPLASGNLNLALHGGEDYELLFAARPSTKIPRSIAGVPITKIGTFTRHTKKTFITSIDREGHRSRLKPAGWEHKI